jgi:hypothetical protein
MNFYQEKLNQIKVALGVAVKMADAILEDGVTKVEAEAFEPGMKIFVVSETGEKAPAPEGTHTTQEGIKVTVDATGTITAVEKPEPEGEDDVEAGKQKMEDEMPAGGPAPEGDVAMEDVIREKVEEKVSEAMEKVYMAIEEVAKEVGIVKEEMAAYKAKMEKMSKTPAANKIPTYNGDPAEAVSAIEVKLSALNELKKEFASKQRIK